MFAFLVCVCLTLGIIAMGFGALVAHWAYQDRLEQYRRFIALLNEDNTGDPND